MNPSILEKSLRITQNCGMHIPESKHCKNAVEKK